MATAAEPADDDVPIDVWQLTIKGENVSPCIFRDLDALWACARTWLDEGEEGATVVLEKLRMSEAAVDALPEFEGY